MIVLMKPRIARFGNCWRCMTLACGRYISGIGRTPAAAYLDWVTEMERIEMVET